VKKLLPEEKWRTREGIQHATIPGKQKGLNERHLGAGENGQLLGEESEKEAEKNR